MTVRIIHFGADCCNRLLVLKHAGYDVDDCQSLIKLGSTLSAVRQPDAVLMTEDPRASRREAIFLVRSHSSAPLVLFQTVGPTLDESEFDLVIPVLTPPHEWLERVTAAIERSRALAAESTFAREESAVLRRETGLARQRAVFEGERSARERSRIDDLKREHREKSAG